MGLQYAIKEVMNVSLVDFVTKKPILFADYAEMSTNESAAERLFINAGQGNYRITSFDHTKTSSLKMTFPIVDLKMLGILAGEDLAIGANNVFKREELAASGTNTITLSAAPVASTLYIYKLDGEKDNGTEQTVGTPATVVNTYSIAGSVVTLNATTAPVGTKFIAFYKYASAATASKITIKANKFPKTLEIYGDGLWKNVENETEIALKMTAYKAKPANDFTLTMSSTDHTKLEVTFDLFAVKSGSDFVYIDYVVLT